MDATFTLTSTSVRPIWGMATSRISTPGFACGFITAIMVLDIMPPYRAVGSQRKTINSSIARSGPPSGRLAFLCMLLFNHAAAERFGFAVGNAERFPLGGTEVLGEED